MTGMLHYLQRTALQLHRTRLTACPAFHWSGCGNKGQLLATAIGEHRENEVFDGEHLEAGVLLLSEEL